MDIVMHSERNALSLTIITLSIAAGLGGPAVAQQMAEGGPAMQIIPLEDGLDREFRPLYEAEPDGPRLSVLEGDPQTGPSVTLFRYSQDYTFSGGLHYHTHDYRLWLIEGELKHWDETGSEETATVLRPGSYLYQPADLLHAANCISEQCTAYVIFDGPIETPRD